MLIQTGNLRSRVASATDEEWAWLASFLAFDDASSRFRDGGRGKAAPKPLQLLDRRYSTFPAGLMPLVRNGAALDHIAINETHESTAPVARHAGAELTWLRDYQREAVNAVCQHVRGILWMPTGAGKTEVAVGLTRALPCKWLFVVHRDTLREQTADRFDDREAARINALKDDDDALSASAEKILSGAESCDIFRGSESGPVWRSQFTVATFQSLYAALKRGDPRAIRLLTEAEGIIVDECHVLPADSFWHVIMSTPNAHFRVGLSGSPLARGDKRSVFAIAALGPVIYRLKPDRLIEAGVLARPIIRFVPVTQTANARTWQGVYSECVVKSAVRNKAVIGAARRAKKPTLVFVQQIEHGKQLLGALQREGVSAEFIFGDAETSTRRAAVTRLERGDTDVLVCSVVFQEGVDIPHLQSVVIASAGRSTIAAVQRVGRGMRTRAKDGSTTKTEFEVWDFDDRGSKMMERHAKERRRAYQREGYSVQIEDDLAVAKPVRRATP
jgi:superfamily II DNA or RNA helicase